MSRVFVQFHDSSERKISSVFGCAQDPAVHKFLGEVDDTDQRLLDRLKSMEMPSLTQRQLAGTERDRLLAIAALVIAPLQDAVDLNDATAAETAQLKRWKQYRVEVNRVDLSDVPVVWPDQPA